MTATERLRAMLDERGVEWTPSVWSAKDETFYTVGEVGFLATEMSNGRMKVCTAGYPTPEQAIEATLGRGECEDIGRLEEENEKLRKERDALDHLTDVLNATNDGLIAENAKLRELVRDVFTIHWHGLDCTECPKRFQDRCTHLGGCEWLGILSDLMRELGVEV